MTLKQRKSPIKTSASTPSKSVVVIGSYREDLAGLVAFSRQLRRAGLQVLHPPARVRRLGEESGFVRLTCDRSSDQASVQRDVFALIDRADAVILYNPSGRVGISAAMEIGYGLRARKPILAVAPPEDSTLRALIRYAPDGLAAFLPVASDTSGGAHAQPATD